MKPAIFVPGYAPFLAALKGRVLNARIRAVRAVNNELILLYWDIGRGIVAQQRAAGWGEGVVDQLASDLQSDFPDMRGFSSRNLRNMKQFFLAYSDVAIWQQLVAKLEAPGAEREKWQQAVAKLKADDLVSLLSQHSNARNKSDISAPETLAQSMRRLLVEVPWGHHVLILNKLSAPDARLYYLQATSQLGWSRSVLLNQIKADAYGRAVKAKKTHNFPIALPGHLAEQADEMMKSSYNLEFLGIGRAVKERELEDLLTTRVQKFILELGYGFCFVGRQHRLAIGQKEYFVDLLFYHRFLKALVAFDLKIGPFEPEHAGKMDFYLNLLNDKERGPEDQPSIGIILCAEKDDVEVEYALRTKANPIGVAEYQLQAKLPAEFKGRLPTARQLVDVVRATLPTKK